MWLLEADEFYSVVKINFALTLALFDALASSPSTSTKRIRKCTIKLLTLLIQKKVNSVPLHGKQAHRGDRGRYLI